MVEREEMREDSAPLNLWWWLTIGYAALAGLAWLTFGIARLLYWQSTQANIAAAMAQNQTVLAQAGRQFANILATHMAFAFPVALVCAFAAIALARRSWNAWDYATLAVGFAAVFSLILLCASERVLYFVPLTLVPLLGMLYLPGTKAACNVKKGTEPEPLEAVPVGTLSRNELEREISKERTLIGQLSQNLDVFEVERAMKTEVFVARYTQGLEEENADNAEWFSIARAVSRSRERIIALTSQLEAVENQ